MRMYSSTCFLRAPRWNVDCPWAHVPPSKNGNIYASSIKRERLETTRAYEAFGLAGTVAGQKVKKGPRLLCRSWGGRALIHTAHVFLCVHPVERGAAPRPRLVLEGSGRFRSQPHKGT